MSLKNCPVCGRSNMTDGQFTEHMHTHDEPIMMSYTPGTNFCIRCYTTYETRIEMIIHMLDKHCTESERASILTCLEEQQNVLDAGATSEKPISCDDVSSSQVEPGASGERVDEDDDEIGVNVEKEAELFTFNEADAAD